MMINTIKAIIILTIATIIIIMAIGYKEKNVIYVIKKVITLTNIQIITNKRQKNFGNKTKNFKKIKTNTTYFWLIIKVIQRMIQMML